MVSECKAPILRSKFVEIGINDCVSGNITDIKARYASLINQLKTDASTAAIIICTMSPCKQRWGDTSQALWEGLNESIRNNEYNADKVCYLHTEAMAYNNNVLRAEYDSGDHLHENTAGAKVIAYCWYSTAMDNSSSGAIAPTVSSISANFVQGDNVIYTNTPLNDLKQYLTVTVKY